MAKESEKSEAEEKPKRKLPLGLILKVGFVVLNIAISGAGLFLVYQSTIGFEKKMITEVEEMAKLKSALDEGPPESIIFTMDPFTVNLDGQPRRIVRAVISLEMMDKKGFEEIVRLGARSRDQIVRLFNRKRFVDIESIQGKLHLKDEIATIVNAELKQGVVKDVYFNEFVVQ